MFHTRANYSINPRNINGFLEDIFQNGFKMMGEDVPNHYNPPVNIQEQDNSYELQLVAPGLKKEDFKLSIDKNVLHISFEQKEEQKDEQAGKWLRKEYKFRSFKRSFTLSDKVNTGGISAKYNDGILNVTLLKKEQAEPTTQEITVG